MTSPRFDLVDPDACKWLATTMAEGAAAGKDDGPIPEWEKMTCEEHLNHACRHILAVFDGDTSEDHLAHAFCRLMFALRHRENDS